MQDLELGGDVDWARIVRLYGVMLTVCFAT